MKRLVSALLLLSAASFFAADSIQLLSDPGMKTASGWKAFGKNAVRKNTRTLVLSKPAGAERERCAWRANTVIPGKQLSGPFILTFESETNGITPARADDAWAGAVVLIHGHKDGKYQNVKVERIHGKEAGFRQYTVKGVIPEKMENLFLEFTLQNASGNVKIKNISMLLEPSGKDGKEEPK